jgi:ComF family protein
LLELLAPSRCAACDANVTLGGFLCEVCDDRGSPLVDSLTDGTLVVAAAAYGGGVARALTRFKYGSRPELAGPLAARLFDALCTANVEGPSVIVPVPLHPHKLARRGYNQSALLGARLSRMLGWPLWPRALVRTRDTVEQASLSREERLTNVAAAIAPRERFAGVHVVLVDDVVTTGATAMACVHALSRAGAGKVTIAAVARATAEADVPRAPCP